MQMKKFESLGIGLSKEQMKKIVGGLYEPVDGTCGYWYTAPTGEFFNQCNVDRSTARSAITQGTQGNWCCDSCPGTWYCG